MGLSWKDLDPTRHLRNSAQAITDFSRSPAQMFRNPQKIFDPGKVINTSQIQKDWRNAGRGDAGKIVKQAVSQPGTILDPTGHLGGKNAFGGRGVWSTFNQAVDDTQKRVGKGVVGAVTVDPYLMVREGLKGNWKNAGDSAGRFYTTGAAVVGAAYGIGSLAGSGAGAGAGAGAGGTGAASGAYGAYPVAADGALGTAGASAGGAAAGSGIGIGSWLQNAGYVAVGAQVLSGKKSADQALYEIGSGQAGDQKWWDAIRDIVGDGTGSNPTPTLDYSGYAGGGMKSLVSPGMIGDIMPLVMVSGLAIGAYFLFFKKKRIFT